MRPLKMRKIGGLDTIEIPPTQPNAPCFVIFHGYGADATDLIPLAQVLRAPTGSQFLFPNGTMAVPISVHMEGRGWWPIDLAGFEKAQREGTYRDLSKDTPQGARDLREKVFGMLNELKIPVSRVVFVGFSQGAMLATMLTLFASESPKGLVILSGNLVDDATVKIKAPNRKGLKFYQSHGTHDPILGFEGAQKLNARLKESGLIGELQSFEGGHEIPQEVMTGVNNYLKDIFSK